MSDDIFKKETKFVKKKKSGPLEYASATQPFELYSTQIWRVLYCIIPWLSFSSAISTPSSTDICQNDGSGTLLNNKDEASWHQMNEDTIKPEVNAQSELEDEEDEVKTLEELQSTINRFPSIFWISH